MGLFLYRRIREKYESEMKEVELNEKHAMEKYNEMKVCCVEVYTSLCRYHTASEGYVDNSR